MNNANEDDEKMLAIKAIQKKLLGKQLSYREIYAIMDEIAHEKLTDILTTYFVASSFREGYSPTELFHFTKAMVETGNKLKFKGIVADKHSVGGIAGTRTTMILVPIIAAAGFKIPKISSRAITTPAGTADVMESIASVEFTPDEIKKIVDKVGGCVAWNGRLGIAPADDIIIRVEEPLSFESFDKIIISVMAKKVAAGTTHLALDLPYGKTAKIRHFSDAEKVAKKFTDLANHFKIKSVVDINEMLEPAGRGIGPILEARDVLYVLEQHKDRPLRLEAKAVRLSGMLLDLCYKQKKIKKNGEDEARKILESGLALKKFREIVAAQKGDKNISWRSLKLAHFKKEIESTVSGRIKDINNYNLNTVAKVLGAPKDKQAGIYLLKKLDHNVDKGEAMLIIYSSDKYRLKEGEVTLKNLPIFTIEK
ncbi:thymidine phosphorylase [Candidatus Roizmanbacteria bacterium]|nr:thymidine phosphorylase [Candidatus Roizmanbacteria bacterium]